MATLTLTLVTGSTTTKTLTMSAPDASRIFSAWQAQVPEGASGTQAGFVDYIATIIKGDLIRITRQAETTVPAKPTIT